MTINEMIKKVNTYNEVARAVGFKELKLTMHYGSDGITFYRTDVEDMKSFKRFLNEELIEECVKAILSESYEFETRKEFNVVFTPAGVVTNFDIEFCLFTK